MLTGGARGAAEYPELELTRTILIPVTAAFGGLAVFIAIFVVASTLGLSIQQREREIALLRAVAATPGQIRRMIAWEAAIVALIGSAAGIWPGIVLGRAIAHGLMQHGIVPPNFTLNYDWLPAAAAICGGVAAALLAVLAAGRRAARVPPTLALTDAAAEPLTSTTLGPSLGVDDTLPAQILAGGQGGGLDVGVATRLQTLAQRYPGLHVSDSASLVTATDADRELNHWLGPFFVVMIFVFTSIAVVNTLIMIALRRRRELALLRLTGASTRQVRSMARWEAILIITMGLGIGLAIAATALLPLSRAFTGGFRPYAPAGWFAAILGVSALLALVALSVPTRRALRIQPVEAIGIRE